MMIRKLGRRALLGLMLLGAIAGNAALQPPAQADEKKPTVVLVHGALADASSWDAVVPKLEADGYPVVAVADPLRSLKGDANYVSSILKAIPGPVVLVGHSYGGSVISNAAGDNANVEALVFVAAFAPEKGESAFDLVGKYPGSELGAALAPPVALADGTHDLTVELAKFAGPFAADLPAARVRIMAATQRPVTDVALKEASGAPAWKSVPSFFVYGSADRSIPPAAHAFMAKRANAKRTVVVEGASHVVMLSHPDDVAKMIEEAAVWR